MSACYMLFRYLTILAQLISDKQVHTDFTVQERFLSDYSFKVTLAIYNEYYVDD